MNEITCACRNAKSTTNMIEAVVTPLPHIFVHVRVSSAVQPAAVAEQTAEEGEQDGEEERDDQTDDEQGPVNSGGGDREWWIYSKDFSKC